MIKTFFMYGIEGINEARPRNDGTPTVPSEKMKIGDFSELLAFNHPLFSTSQIVTDPTSTSFAKINSSTQANYPRRIQLTVKFLF